MPQMFQLCKALRVLDIKMRVLFVVLLATAIDKDHINNLGWTALLEAVILGDGGATHTEIVRLLVEAGANPSLADRDGVTPLAHAKKSGYSGMVRILSAAGAR